MKAKVSNDKTIILNIPDHNGTILNSRSLIDCYYWGKDVVTSLEAGMEEKIDEEEVQVTLATRDFVRETANQLGNQLTQNINTVESDLTNKIDGVNTKIDTVESDLTNKINSKKDEDNVQLTIVD